MWLSPMMPICLVSGLKLSVGSRIHTYPNRDASFEIAPSALRALDAQDRAVHPAAARARGAKVVMHPAGGSKSKLHMRSDD